ncbi:hypothetical protein OAN99_03545 [Flavobacteriaceae bacterium]|nr:hypothetical protein [Flavobacteriaceae bacterium]
MDYIYTFIKKSFFVFYIFVHISCDKEKFDIYGKWQNDNKDTYFFKYDYKLTKTIKSDNGIKILGEWKLKKEKILLDDTINIRVNYQILKSEDFEKKINTTKLLKIHILNFNKFEIVNENRMIYNKIPIK